jgi:two-component system response regulator AlgR
MKILIADDEAPARSRLRQMLEEHKDLEVVGEASHGRAVLKLCQELSPDIVLLDIRMPDMDGIEAARHLSTLESGPAVIFTTAYEHYAIQAFDAHAIGYLLKPVRHEKLLNSLRRASQSGGTRIEHLARDEERLCARINICARRSSGLYLIPVSEILYVHADHKYVTVSHLNGEDLIDEPLKDLADEFRDRFIRIHRSALIALDYLDRMEKNAQGHYEVWLKHCAEPLPVSRRHVSAVKSRLMRNS